MANGAHGLQIWRLTANMLTKQLQKTDKQWSSSFADSANS
jgi:hypothetical protein